MGVGRRHHEILVLKNIPMFLDLATFDSGDVNGSKGLPKERKFGMSPNMISIRI
jgi:hypothetical protein